MGKFNRCHFPCAAGDKLQTYTTCSGEEIEHFDVLEVDTVIKQVE